MKPLAVDLFCGLGGWSEGFLSEGYDVIGFDIERRPYPAQLVLQDVLTLDGSQFRNAAVIVASPPCQRYSYMAMPWDRAKREIRWQQWMRTSPFSPGFDLNDLFDSCFRIQREASEAAGRYIPLVVENVKGAQPWVGRAKWHYGFYYLWGDVPALMPFARAATKVPGLNWSGSDKPGYKAEGFNMTAEQRMREGMKRPGRNFHAYENGLGSSPSFNGAEHETRGVKNGGHGTWFNVSHGKVIPGNQAGAPQRGDGLNTFGWAKDTPLRNNNSHNDARKAASAQIAKIPFELAWHIAAVYKPECIAECKPGVEMHSERLRTVPPFNHSTPSYWMPNDGGASA